MNINRFKSTVIITLFLLLACNFIQAATDIVELSEGITTYSSRLNAAATGGNAFDGEPTTRWLTAAASTGFVGFQFTNNTSYVIKSYRIWNLSLASTLSRSIKDFSLQGSNDGSNWTVLDSQTNQVSWEATEARNYIFDNDTAFSYFKLVITANNGGSYTGLNELELFETSDFPDFFVYENFETLTVGALNGQGTAGNGWTAPWGALSQVSVTNIDLSYIAGDVKIIGDSKAMLISDVSNYNTAYRPFEAQAEPVLYISALIRSKNITGDKMLTLSLQNSTSVDYADSAGFDF
jgi:hypothetical protein